MKYASTFLMGLSLSLLSMGCGDATTEQSINPDGPDPSQFSGAQTGPYDESNPGGAAAAPAEDGAKTDGEDAKPADKKDGGDAKPAPKKDGGDAKPAPKKDAGDAKPAPKKDAGDKKPAPKKDAGDKKPAPKKKG
ncbi:MAG: hypothetical protein VX669_16490 [Planctomycetota bacterium]|nr:hypothetical protein [Planctomycetota bacterium]